MRLRARNALLPVVVGLVLALFAGLAGPAAGRSASTDPGTAGGTRPGPRTHVLDRLPLPVRTTPPSGHRDGALPTFTGHDGVTYSTTPLVVPGKNGVVYIGQDFDSGCAYGGKLRDAMRQLVHLVDTIRKTGRKVVFTVAPNKSSVDKADLPDALPHGACDSEAIATQDLILDQYQHPSYVQLRSTMAARTARGRQLFWDLDTHWNSVATGLYAKAVARQLDPSLAKEQSCRKGPETILVDLAAIGALDQRYETGPGCSNTTPVKVRPAPGSTPFDPSVLISGDIAWNTGPKRRTWTGRTALLGDSFTYRALDNLMPLFRHGHFVWMGAVDLDTIIKTLAQSDTVVIESVQRFLGASLLSSTQFRLALKQAMADFDQAHPRH